MHEHKWKSTSNVEEWKRSPHKGLLMAYEVRIKRCECGEEAKIKTAPRGTWWKGVDCMRGRIMTYPERWKKVLRDCLAGAVEGEKTLRLDILAKRSGLPWSEVEHFSESLIMDGLADRFERYPKKSPGDVKIVISKENVQYLRELLGLTGRDKEELEIDSFFENVEKEGLPEDPPVIVEAIINMARLWKDTRKPIIVLSDGETMTLKSLANYRLILSVLMEIAGQYLHPLSPSPKNMSAGEGQGGSGKRYFTDTMIPFRELSVRITGNSKGLSAIRPYLKDILGDLKDFGIIEHSPLLLCRIPVTGEVGGGGSGEVDKHREQSGHRMDLSAAVDYAVITESTALEFRPTQGRFKSLLLIENLTTFESMVSRLPEDMGSVFMSGYPPGHVQSFVRNLLRFKPVPGYIWCDIDPDGIEIALTAGKWFEEAGQKWHPVGMDKERLIEAAARRPLDDRDREKLGYLKNRAEVNIFLELIEEMERAGTKVEQEAIGDHILPDIQALVVAVR